MKSDFLKIKNLVKEFGNGENIVRAVDSINLDVKEGELVTLLGPSGCGKTTTLRMISGFENPSSGNIFIDDEIITSVPPNKRPTTMVFQNYALFPHMTVYENISYGLKLRGDSKNKIKEKAYKIMDLVGLEELAGRSPNQLSGGQQQRVSLARAMVMEPKVLLFDEPLSNLDAKLRVSMRIEIRKIQQRVGITSVYVTHDQEEAMTLSDRVVIMKDGKIQQIGSPREIYAHPENKFIAGFIGRANFIDCWIDSIRADKAIINVAGNELKVKRYNKNIKDEDRALAVVRPESIDLGPKSSTGINAKVVDAVYLGSQVSYTISLEKSILTVDISDPQESSLFKPGEIVSVKFKENSIHLLPFES